MQSIRYLKKKHLLLAYIFLAGVILTTLLVFVRQTVTAQGSPLHPDFPLLNQQGESVLSAGGSVSTMQTCGGCHDTAFIEEHSFHADVGLDNFGDPGLAASGREWDTSPGLFGKWNPLTYRYLSPEGDDRLDMTTPEWVQRFGIRHIGGGPAVYSQDGELLTELDMKAGDPESHIIDPESGEMKTWDWEESGVVEMNCFLCHIASPNNAARIDTLHAGEFQWANTATLLGTGIVNQANGEWIWNSEAFNQNGELNTEFIVIQDPSNENCAQCHGLVHVNAQTPLLMNACQPEQWSTITTGQIFSPQRIADSGLNLASKDDLSRTWDVHAERVIECTDCHYSLNNPIYFEEANETRPAHLTFDPRRIDLGEYLYRPSHQFAKGQSAQGTLAPELDNTLRRCESCHSIENTHDWLPYKEQHTNSLSCETCHIPKLYAPARQYVDWTVLQNDGSPQSGCRGVEGEGDTLGNILIKGYEPVLLPRQNSDGSTSLAPHNLITAWYWVYGSPTRPVPLRDLQAAWLDADGYPEDILETFDEDRDGQLDNNELVIDSAEKEGLIAGRLAALGLDDPRIVGDIQPYSINHDVTHSDWAIRDCRTCHGEDSRISATMLLAGKVPGGVMPAFVEGDTVLLDGELVAAESGELYYRPQTSTNSDLKTSGLYILGHDSVYWIDRLGALIFLGTLIAIAIHGGLRYFAARRRPSEKSETEEVYMYGVYERLWHWLQTFVIVGLLFTGLIIHKPDIFGIFSFKYMVEVHNILAFLLAVNAAMALFYHLASGEIRQFLPRPYGFFDQAIEQGLYYLRGIFRGEPHPFEKTRHRKMNPLQQVTYFAILNVLLPLQGLTGILMWGAQKWPQIAATMGGLSFLAPFHTLVAWLFASFIVAHVYLTTTGHTVTASIRAMIMGWDEVEVHPTSVKEEMLQL